MSGKYEVSGKVVLITGAAGGVGAAAADSFLRDGAKHVVIVDIAEAGAARATTLNIKYGADKASLVKCDVTDDVNLFAAFDRVTAEQGRLDVIVNNAGILNDSKEAFKKMIELNVAGTVGSTLKAIDMWRADKGGSGGTIINVASKLAIKFDAQTPIYGCTKAAVLHFSQCIGNEMHYKQTKVRVLSICPGVTQTQLFGEFATRRFTTNYEESPMTDVDPVAMGQPAEAVGDAIVEAYKQADSGATWLISNAEPPQDITRQADERFFLGRYE